MSDTKPLLVRTFVQENTTLNPYRIAKLGTSDNQVVAEVDGSALPVGITDETADATANRPVGLVMQGIALCTILAASTKGGAIVGTTDGKGAVTTTAGKYCVGWLLETTTVANQRAKVIVNPFLYPATS